MTDDRTEREKYLEEIHEALKQRCVDLEFELSDLKDRLATALGEGEVLYSQLKERVPEETL